MHDRSKVQVRVVDLPAMNTPQFDWIKNRLPEQPQPVPPIYQPEIAAEAIYYAAHHSRKRSRSARPPSRDPGPEDRAGPAGPLAGPQGLQGPAAGAAATIPGGRRTSGRRFAATTARTGGSANGRARAARSCGPTCTGIVLAAAAAALVGDDLAGPAGRRGGCNLRLPVRTVATIDIGTNTTLLLVARTEPAIEVIEERAEITRLGRGIGGDGALGTEGIDRTLAVLRTTRTSPAAITRRSPPSAPRRCAGRPTPPTSWVRRPRSWAPTSRSSTARARRR